jgi:hypothetical protein
MQGDAQRGIAKVLFRNATNQSYIVEIPLAILGSFLINLRAIAQQIMAGTSSAPFLGQPLTLNSGRPFQVSDDRVGLELTLDNGLRLPVVFPRSAIKALRKSLDALDSRATDKPEPKVN